MAKKILAVALALVFVFGFGLVASAEDGGYVCECPVDSVCVEECDCAEPGECVCPPVENNRSNVWKIILGVVAGILSIVAIFFITRGVLTCVFC
ncbi:MAG: DUF3827 domain-containing protein [Oscillospiraceae bacterium]|nr:DUF3827 domain-containing protein [Oscillospiraceae bacterium]